MPPSSLANLALRVDSNFFAFACSLDSAASAFAVAWVSANLFFASSSASSAAAFVAAADDSIISLVAAVFSAASSWQNVMCVFVVFLWSCSQ